MKVSIIIPVYNCEKYLDRCVETVLKQTYKNIELLLINDGSSDSSGALCDAWAEKDTRVRVIHQPNRGVSAARNAGLDAATGDVIGFVDADDYIHENTYAVALERLTDCDMVVWDAVTVWDSGRTEEDTIPLLPETCVLKKENWKPALLRQMAGATWRCLYRAELVKNIRFPVGIKLSEDRLFNLQAMGKADKVQYLKEGLYYRYVRQGSACNRYHGDVFEQNLAANTLAQQIVNDYWTEKYCPTYIRTFVIGGALQAIYEICSRNFSGKSRLAAIRSITKHPELKAAFTVCVPDSFREKILQKETAGLLLLMGCAYNIKHGG